MGAPPEKTMLTLKERGVTFWILLMSMAGKGNSVKIVEERLKKLNWGAEELTIVSSAKSDIVNQMGKENLKYTANVYDQSGVTFSEQLLEPTEFPIPNFEGMPKIEG